MKCLIVNAKGFDYTDKKTGEFTSAIVFDVVSRNRKNKSGRGVIAGIFIGKKFDEELYNFVICACNGNPDEFQDKICHLDYDNEKNLVDFECVKSDSEDPPVIWNF